MTDDEGHLITTSVYVPPLVTTPIPETAESYRDLMRAQPTERDATNAYTSGFSDGYDAALDDVNARVPWAVALVVLGGIFVIGCFVGAALV